MVAVEEKKRRGRPMAGVVLDGPVLKLVEGYRKGRGLKSTSAALRELIEYALGSNPHGLSAVEDWLAESNLKQKLVESVDAIFPNRTASS